MPFDKYLGYSIECMPQADTAGSIDLGILAATWSPHETSLALFTGTLLTSAIHGD